MSILNKIGLLALLAMVVGVSAQVTNTNTVAGAGAVTPPMDLWTLAIGLISPVLIWGLTKIAPRIPRPLLPTLTPFLGMGLGLLVNWLAGQNLSWFDAAKAGATAVFFRELVNQWITKQLAAPVTTVAEPPLGPVK